MTTTEILNNLFLQAKSGEIKIESYDNDVFGPLYFYTKFFTNIEGNLNVKLNLEKDFENNLENKQKSSQFSFLPPDNQTMILSIPDFNSFVSACEKYLEKAEEFYTYDKAYFALTQDSHRQKLLLDLIVNATPFDLSNIMPYIKSRTRMLKNPLKEQIFDIENEILPDISLKCSISKNLSNLEAPYKFEIAFFDQENNKFKLPSVTFGKDGQNINVYAIQTQKQKQTNPLAKKLDRYFRKLNLKVDENDYIANISPNALASLTIFISAMKSEGIKNFVAYPYMPLRYESNLSAKKRVHTDKELLMQTVEEHDRIQYNITNKLIYSLARYSFHFDNFVFDYDEITSLAHLNEIDNHIIRKNENIIYNLDKLISCPLNIFNNEEELVK